MTITLLVFANQERDRGHIGQCGGDRYRHHRAVLGDLRRVHLYLVGGFRGLAVEQFDRVSVALLLERFLRIFVVGRGKGLLGVEGDDAKTCSKTCSKTDHRDRARALQHQPSRGRKSVVRDAHPESLLEELRRQRHSVCRKSTTALISFSVRIRFRPNGGITVCGLRLVSSVTIAIRSSRLGYLLLRSTSCGPMLPGRSPPLISWQVRQLPLPRSNAIFCPSAEADWARAGPARPTPASSARTRAVFRDGWATKGVSQTLFSMNRNIRAQKHKGHCLAMWRIGAGLFPVLQPCRRHLCREGLRGLKGLNGRARG